LNSVPRPSPLSPVPAIYPQSLAFMTKLCTFAGATIGSYAGWFLGLRFGYFAAFVISGVASLIGVYAGWKLAQRLS
jgi:hypothetical protein